MALPRAPPGLVLCSAPAGHLAPVGDQRPNSLVVAASSRFIASSNFFSVRQHAGQAQARDGLTSAVAFRRRPSRAWRLALSCPFRTALRAASSRPAGERGCPKAFATGEDAPGLSASPACAMVEVVHRPRLTAWSRCHQRQPFHAAYEPSAAIRTQVIRLPYCFPEGFPAGRAAPVLRGRDGWPWDATAVRAKR